MGRSWVRPGLSLLALVTPLSAVAVAGGCSSKTQADDGKVCTPGANVFCRCQNRDEGTKPCSADGKSFGACQPCPGDDPGGPPPGGNPPPVGGDKDSGIPHDAGLTPVDSGPPPDAGIPPIAGACAGKLVL